MATAIHLPTVSTIATTYASLTHWTQINGFQPIGPWRELTYTQEGPNPEHVIEVQRPIMKAIEYYSPLEVKEMEPKIITNPASPSWAALFWKEREHGDPGIVAKIQ